MKKSNNDLPYSLIAEKMIIKSILINSDSINFVTQNLNVEAFYFKEYREIYKAALSIFSKEKVVNFVTLTNQLQTTDTLNLGSILELLNELMQENINFVNLDEYIALLNDKYLRRLLIQFGKEIIEFGYETNFSLEIIFNTIEKKLFNLTNKKISKNLSTSAEILTEILVELKEKNKQSLFSGFLSRFNDLNLMTQGFQKSDLIIVAGRPSMGKTAFALNIAIDIINIYNIPVVIFSLEMTKQQLMYRLLSMETGIKNTRLKLGHLNQNEWLKINAIIKKLADLPIYIDDTPNISLSEIRLKMQKIKIKHGKIGPVIVDYLQLLESTIKISNRVQEITSITRTLKGIAREFQIPLIVLSQLSRNLESRSNKRPILSDLRDSGCLNINTLKSSYAKFSSPENKFRQKSLFSYISNYLIANPNFKIRFTGLKPVYKTSTNFGSSLYLTGGHKLKEKKIWRNLNYLNRNSLLQTNLSNLIENYFFKKIIFNQIRKIQYVGLEKTYDISLEKIYNFLSEGIVVHNSIEQDADVVLMLHRENYYSSDTKNEKNMVEIIIAKHRTGPVGNVKLLFDPNSTKFYNLT